MENHFTFHHLESTKFSLSEILFNFRKPCLERVCSFFSAHLSDCHVSFCSANRHPFIPSVSFLPESFMGLETRQSCLLEQFGNQE